jgi:arylsulfatase A-like enzyme
MNTVIKRFFHLLPSGVNGPALALMLAFAGGCSGEQAPLSAGEDPLSCPVILLSLDTLRADHLHCYGYPRETSPNIDRFSRDCVLFSNAIAQAPSTLPSHASLFTSLIVMHHGAFDPGIWGGYSALVDENLTMAEVLKANGYRTVSFNGNGYVAKAFGFQQGFDLYDDTHKGRFESVVPVAVDWIRRFQGDKFFLFLHTYEVHHPYTPLPRFAERFDAAYSGPLPDEISLELIKDINAGRVRIDEADREHVVNMYDAEILSMDEAFGTFIRLLKEEGVYDESMIIVTADHGEEFGEHGMMGWHSHTLFDELLRVPLLIKFPRGRYGSTTVDAPVRLIDVLPTVHEVLGLDLPEVYEGKSLLCILSGEETEVRPSMSSTGANDEYSLRTDEWKLYVSLKKGTRLYNLKQDPGERTDVAKDHADLVKELTRMLNRQVKSRPPVKKRSEVELDPETLKNMEALGYGK